MLNCVAHNIVGIDKIGEMDYLVIIVYNKNYVLKTFDWHNLYDLYEEENSSLEDIVYNNYVRIFNPFHFIIFRFIYNNSPFLTKLWDKITRSILRSRGISLERLLN